MKETIEEIKVRVKNSQKNYSRNIATIEDILKEERGYVSRIPENEEVVALYSGGLDSTVMLNIVMGQWNSRIYPLFIRRGARAEKLEEKAFDYFVDFYKNKFPDNMKDGYKIDFQVPPEDLKKEFPKNFVTTVGHPLRNSTMQNLAVMYAVSLNGKYDLDIKTILTGSVGEDNTEPELGILSLRSQTLSTCIQLGDWNWQITSPLTDPEFGDTIYKVQLIKYATEKGIPLEKTRSCFNSEEIADGTCNACTKRLEAFEYLKIKDPAKYQGEKNE